MKKCAACFSDAPLRRSNSSAHCEPNRSSAFHSYSIIGQWHDFGRKPGQEPVAKSGGEPRDEDSNAAGEQTIRLEAVPGLSWMSAPSLRQQPFHVLDEHLQIGLTPMLPVIRKLAVETGPLKRWTDRHHELTNLRGLQ